MDTNNYAPPHATDRTPLLRDVDGHTFLNIDGLRARGDLVAGYDPADPDRYDADLKQVKLNRELELAREKAKADEVARLKAEKDAEKAKADVKEAEMVAAANAERLRIAEEERLAMAAEYEKKLAEATAQLEAMAKDKVEPKAKTRTPVKKKASLPEAGGTPAQASNLADKLDEVDNNGPEFNPETLDD